MERPSLQAFCAAMALPSTVCGPVECWALPRLRSVICDEDIENSFEKTSYAP